MPKLLWFDGDAPREQLYIPVQQPKRYGFFNFFFDCTMLLITGGFWLIWIFIRELRRPRYW